MNSAQKYLNWMVAGLLAVLVSLPAWAGKGPGLVFTELSDDEVVMLNYMREEEKLARDVYLLLYDYWGAAIFTTISDSEQQHMDTMEKMVDKYGLDDPAQDALGVFTDPNLQEKYDGLVASGVISYINGLIAGATIEEIDMVDILHAIEVTEHDDLNQTYGNLLDGSKNHLRAFVGALETQGYVYEPQFISPELFAEIMAE